MPTITLRLTEHAQEQLDALEKDPSQQKRFRKVRRALGFLQTNLKHPSLNPHKIESLTHRLNDGRKADVWEAYAENQTSGAYRIFYHLGHPGVVEVIAIREHL